MGKVKDHRPQETDDDLLDAMFPGMWTEPVGWKHFPECYITRYPNDPGVHCTCMDWSPE